MVDGKLGLISEGITFAMKQMAAGIVAFTKGAMEVEIDR